jgi:hypothetical protein
MNRHERRKVTALHRHTTSSGEATRGAGRMPAPVIEKSSQLRPRFGGAFLFAN